MRSLLVVGLLGLAVGRATADQPRTEDERIRARLRSPLAVEVAWGLHDAIEARLTGADDLVLAALDRWARDGGPSAERVRGHAVDAIIDLDIDLAPERLRALAPELSTPELLILAARDPQTHRALLRPLLLRHTSEDAWTATCNLLVGIRDPVAAQHLVGRLRMEAHVTLRDPGDVPRFGVGGVTGGYSGGTGCGRVGPPHEEGWPPRTTWQLLSTPVHGARLVAKGREPIYAERRELDTGDFVCSTFRGARSRDYAAQAYVAELLGWDVDRLRSGLRDYRTVPFTGLDAWARTLEDVRRDLGRVWLRVLVACWLADLLSPEQILGLPPKIEFKVRDERSTREPVLPAIAPPVPSDR